MSKKYFLIALVILVLGVGVLVYMNYAEQKGVIQTPATAVSGDYNPVINPADFTTAITNKYVSLPKGRKLTYEGESDKGHEKVVIEITGETKMISGVNTLVYLDTVYENGVLLELTRDYLAQDKLGNVWYFGEDVNNYDEKGKLADHKGTFLYGVDGAKPGIWMKAEQKVGDSYRQEYYKGQAEDMRDTIALNQTVKTALATYSDCVEVLDWSPLEPGTKEYKYYCPSVAAEVRTNENGKNIDLVSVK